MDDAGSHVTLKGTIEAITFHNPENHYTIARLRPAGGQGAVSILGYLPQAAKGESLQVTGHWVQHPRYGAQLKVTHFELLLPDTVEGIRRYLEAGIIPGVGPKTVDRMVRLFGAELLTVLDQAPERLCEVQGIGPRTADAIGRAWADHHALRELMAFLQTNGLKPSFCGPLTRAYGDEALNVLQTEPFRVIDDLPGIGFVIADTVARSQGTAADDPRRVRACLRHLLDQAALEGHVCWPEEQLLGQAAAIFGIDPAAGGDTLAALLQSGQLIRDALDPVDGPRVYLPELHAAELGLARRLQAMQQVAAPASVSDEAVAAMVGQRLALVLSEAQLQVLQAVMRERVAVITGGPGTGKTTLIRALATVYQAMGQRVCLAAPTGRAARRLAEVTRQPAATLHKLLGFNPLEGGFQKDQDDPLEADVFVVDEASMVDVALAHSFFKAVSLNSAVILVGDVFQLPSVGPGSVLQDLIASRRVAVHYLSEIFRQAAESAIVSNAHRVREGRWPQIQIQNAPSDASFQFIAAAKPAEAARLVDTLCARELPRRYGLDPVRDIQVITPMHKGEAGTLQLNQLLQRRLNPPSAGARLGFGPGDKVMHLRNNYAKEVFNGDIGVVAEVNSVRERVAVNYDDRLVTYDFAELDELTLAYAITVHKSQGSEYPAVVLPLLTQHYALLQRNLLYTAITRGKAVVVIVGSRRALEIALRNDRPRRRMSWLRERLTAAA
jgi:exodeoxyribonuclease V alpha subunit